jgi:hypothetical protein
LTIFANTTQRKLQFVTRIQLSKNKHSEEQSSKPVTNLKEISER